MKLPDEVTSGQPVSAKDFNTLLRYLRSMKITGGPGVWVTQTMAGTTIKLAPDDSLQAGGITSIIHPFLVTNASTDTAAKVSVRSGSVNDIVPTGVAPTLQNMTAAGTWRVYLDCTLNGAGTVTAVAVGVVNGDQPADSDTHAYITIAIVTVVALDGGSGFAVSDIEQLVTHSLRFFACGRATSGESITTRGTYNFWGI